MLSTNKLIQISNKLNRPANGQLSSLAFLSHCRPNHRFDDKPIQKSTIDRNDFFGNLLGKTPIDSPINTGSVAKTREIFISKIRSEINPTIKTTVNLNRSLNFSQTVNLSAGRTHLVSVRHLSSSANPGDVNKSKDPFFEFEGLSKRKSRARSVFAWGLSATGAVGNTKYFNLGDLKYEQILKPFKVRYFTNMRVSNVAAGHGFTLVAAEANDTDHKLFGFGLNNYCQIGFHRDPKTREILKQLILPCPIALPLQKKEKIRDIACGRAHTIILTNQNKLMSIGNNSFGQCGRQPVEDEDYFRNYRVHLIDGIDEEIDKIICGQDHSLFLTKSGKLFACGWGADGQTGLGSYKIQGTPKQISGDLDGEKVVAVATTADAVLAANEKGELFGWGNSEYAQFRAVTEEMQLNVPRMLKYDSLKGKKVVDVACGGTTCAVLDEEGCVHVWGYGILGKGPKIDHLKEPSMLPRPLFGYNEVNDDVRVVKIEAGLGHFGAITNNGDFFMWGRNREGCLGLNQKQNQFFPLRVPLAANVKKASLGIDHTVALVTSMV